MLLRRVKTPSSYVSHDYASIYLPYKISIHFHVNLNEFLVFMDEYTHIISYPYSQRINRP